MFLYLVSVVFEYCHVNKFIFFCGFEMHTVFFTKLLLKLWESRIYQYFLKLTDNLIELIIFCVVHAAIADFKILIFSEIVTNQVLTYKNVS